MYYERLIDKYLSAWAEKEEHKPILLRGARQVGKSTAVRHLGEIFEAFVEVNFEKNAEFKMLFDKDLDVKRIVSQIAVMMQTPIVEGKTLLFFDEIQACPNCIMALRFFKEDMPKLHIIAAGSLLEFALQELPTFGVGRIHSMFMYPMTFDEFLLACGEQLLLTERNNSSVQKPLPEPLHGKLIELFRTFLMVGGFPEVVDKWVRTHDFLSCQEVQDDIIISYEDDFPKYRKRIEPILLRLVLRSVAVQMPNKFVYSKVSESYKTSEIKKALDLLTLAGIIIPVTHSSANGLPLGSEADDSFRKFLLMDTGLTLRLLNITLGDVSQIATHILTASVQDLVNKGPLAEQAAGLEFLHYQSPNIRQELFYWSRQSKNSLAEIDYVSVFKQKVLPIEIKAGVQGGMKSLWIFMREKHLDLALRCSLENFGSFEYSDKESDGAVRNVSVCPLYALSMADKVLDGKGRGI